MQRKLSLPLWITMIFFSLFILASCEKESSQSGTAAQEEEASRVSAESAAEAEAIFSGSFDDAMGVNADLGLAGTGIFWGRPGNSDAGSDQGRPDSLVIVPRCFTVTITRPGNTPFPVRVEINFGTTGCLGPDGHTRKGKIIIEYTNRLLVPGATATTVFDGYYIDDISVQGTHKITNTSTPNNRQFKVEVIDGRLGKPNGNFIEWNSIRIITQIEGLGTPDYPRDDIFWIEGNASGAAKRGNLLVRWESDITEPLVRRFTCRWIVKGIIRSIRANTNASSPWVATLNFGAGQCDNQATLTINGVSRQITLP